MQVETTNTQLKFKWVGPGSGLWRGLSEFGGLIRDLPLVYNLRWVFSRAGSELLIAFIVHARCYVRAPLRPWIFYFNGRLSFFLVLFTACCFSTDFEGLFTGF